MTTSELASRSAPERVVDLVHNVRRTNHAVIEVTAVQTLQGLLAAGDRVELDVDIAVGVGVDRDVNDFSVLLVALSLDFDLQLLGPVGAVILELPRNVLARRDK